MRRSNLTYMTFIPMLAVIFLISGCYTQVGTIKEERPAAREEVYVEEYYDDTGTTYRYYSDDYYYDDYSYRSPRHRMFFSYYYPTHYSFGWGVHYDPFWYDRYYVWDPWHYPRYSYNIYFGWPSWRYHYHTYYRWYGGHYMYPWGPWHYTHHYPLYTYYPSHAFRDRQRTPRTFGTTRGYSRDGTYRLPSAGRTTGDRTGVTGRRDTEGRTGAGVRDAGRTRTDDTRVRSRDPQSGREGSVRQPTRTRTPERVRGGTERGGTQREGATRDSGRSRDSQQESTRSRDNRSRGDQSSGTTVRERSTERATSPPARVRQPEREDNRRSEAPAPRVRSQNTETRTQSTPPTRVRSQGSQTRTRVQSTPSRDRRESVQSRPAPRRDSGSSVRRSSPPPQRSVSPPPQRSSGSSSSVRSGGSSSRSSGSRDSGSSRGGRQR